MLLAGIYPLQGFLNGTTCSSFENYKDRLIACAGSFSITASIANIQVPSDSTLLLGKNITSKTYRPETHGLLILLYVLFTVIILFFIRIHHQKTVKKLDEDWTTPADFTVQVKNIPKNQSKQQISEFFTNKSLKNKITKVYKVVKAYNIIEFCDKTLLKTKLNLKLKKAEDDKLRQQLENQIGVIDKELLFLSLRKLQNLVMYIGRI